MATTRHTTHEQRRNMTFVCIDPVKQAWGKGLTPAAAKAAMFRAVYGSANGWKPSARGLEFFALRGAEPDSVVMHPVLGLQWNWRADYPAKHRLQCFLEPNEIRAFNTCTLCGNSQQATEVHEDGDPCCKRCSKQGRLRV